MVPWYSDDNTECYWIGVSGMTKTLYLHGNSLEKKFSLYFRVIPTWYVNLHIALVNPETSKHKEGMQFASELPI